MLHSTRRLATTTRRCMSTAAKTNPTRALLDATLPFVPQHGWSMESMVRGAKALGYPSVAHGVFEHGEASLVDAFLRKCRFDHVALIQQSREQETEQKKSIGEYVREYTALRLELMKPYAARWPEALAIMAHPSNVPMSVTHLAELVDDVLYHAGDRSPDFNWYVNRAGLAAVYTSTELFMTQDRSADYAETFRFLDRRLEQVAQVEAGKKELGTMLEFGAKSVVGLLGIRGIQL
ncbi:rpsU-divergently transcribed protein [Fennellomyces sp. T-0311]|nr:rpsU-divergently transcribed protein [Fennellomyces sp. T-0311]